MTEIGTHRLLPIKGCSAASRHDRNRNPSSVANKRVLSTPPSAWFLYR
ncbi:MAG: hypothetical protein RSB85_08155 [Rikenellaceae bacterium]